MAAPEPLRSRHQNRELPPRARRGAEVQSRGARSPIPRRASHPLLDAVTAPGLQLRLEPALARATFGEPTGRLPGTDG